MANSVIDKALQQTMQDQVKEKVLWKNASPDSTFPQQNVTVANLADYDQYEIEAKYLVTRAWTDTCVTSGDTYTAINMVYGESNRLTGCYRPVTINKQDITRPISATQ